MHDWLKIVQIVLKTNYFDVNDERVIF